MLPSEKLPKVSEVALDELRRLYMQLTVELEPFRRHCDTRGLCCNFPKTGHRLYVTGLESAEMASSGILPNLEQSAQGICPFLQDKICGIRDHRALGCRIYFCDRTYEEERNALYERFLKVVRELEVRHGIEHSYQSVTCVDFDKLNKES